MKRKLFNSAALLSLLLCVATVVLWAWSYRSHDEVCVTNARNWAVYAASLRGGIVIGYVHGGPFIAKDVAPGWGIGPQGGWSHRTFPSMYSYRDASPPLDKSLTWRLGGFALLGGRLQGSVERSITLPYWSVLLLTSTMPVLWMFRMFRIYRRRKLIGGCPKCFYNLTGNTSGVCPECGTVVAGKAGE